MASSALKSPMRSCVCGRTRTDGSPAEGQRSQWKSDANGTGRRARRLASVRWYQIVHSVFSKCRSLYLKIDARVPDPRDIRAYAPTDCSHLQTEDLSVQHAEPRRTPFFKGIQAMASCLCAVAVLTGTPSIAYGAERGAFVRPDRNGPIIDGANIIPDGREGELASGLTEFGEKTGWKIRIVTRNGPGSFPSGNEVRSVWNLDARTIVVIDDVSAPNVLNFNTGDGVRGKLPRQFFTELQSRFGNQFFIAEEGNAKALADTVGALRECLEREKGCRFVPGLVDDLYFLTLACSVAAGAVFGFSARVPLSGRVNNQLTWILVFAPLWAFLLITFGILPVTSRTADLEPLLKNGAAFLAAGAAVYLTPILGTPELPFSRTSAQIKSDDDDDE